MPVRLHHHTLVTSSEVVQQGDRSRTNVKTHYTVEESELPIVDLLATDPHLVRSLLEAIDEPEVGVATLRFLHDVLRAAGRADDLALLDYGTDLTRPGTSIFALFGVDFVDRASAVMVGSGNQLRTEMRVDHRNLSPGTILADLEKVRQHAAPPPPPPRRAPIR